jgi:hypothetical protein
MEWEHTLSVDECLVLCWRVLHAAPPPGCLLAKGAATKKRRIRVAAWFLGHPSVHLTNKTLRPPLKNIRKEEAIAYLSALTDKGVRIVATQRALSLIADTSRE